MQQPKNLTLKSATIISAGKVLSKKEKNRRLGTVRACVAKTGCVMRDVPVHTMRETERDKQETEVKLLNYLLAEESCNRVVW